MYPSNPGIVIDADSQEEVLDNPFAMRAFVTRQLISLSKTAVQDANKIKALELLGKSIGLFSEAPEAAPAAITADELKVQLMAHMRLIGLS